MNRKQNLHATIILLIEYNVIMLILHSEGRMKFTSLIILHVIGSLMLIINYYIFDNINNKKNEKKDI
jgi:hypothetical protein